VPYVRYGRSTRRPFLVELYGSPGGVLPNTDLKNETSNKIESGLSTPYGQVGYFHAKDENLIFLADVTPITVQYQNIQSGKRDGIFLDGQYDFTRYWDANLNYQYVISKMTEDGTTSEVPRSARQYGVLSSALKNIPLDIWDSQPLFFSGYGSVRYESAFYLDYANINRMKIPPLYNAGIRFLFTRQKNNFILSCDVENLTNEQFATVYNGTGVVLQVNSNGYFGFPPPGRRIYLSLTGEF
jgi:outer membrane receptor protein involved in Fe transport